MGLPSFLLPRMDGSSYRLPPIHTLDMHGSKNNQTLPPLNFALHEVRNSKPPPLLPISKGYLGSIPTTEFSVGDDGGYARINKQINHYEHENLCPNSTFKDFRTDSVASEKLSSFSEEFTPSPNVKREADSPIENPENSGSSSENELANNSIAGAMDEKIKKGKVWKPRKKKQCPECHLFFSNLATHKSTHLKPTSRPHVCEYCGRGFARPNDLFRHVKCHWKETGSDKGQFKCPYKNHEKGDFCGHSTGIFSRCDTFKNHLRAIHFQYPQGTKKDQRNKVSGTCKMCHRTFKNVDDWLTNHIEKNDCHITL